MARALRRTGLTLALPALIGLSTIVHWLAGRRIPGLWIMPDEAIYAERAIALWKHGSLSLLHGDAGSYGLLYPVIAGLPFSVGSFAHGYASLKLLQAFVMSLAAVPVFAFGRRWMPDGYALLASALCLCSPLLLYSGLVMTEVVFYPLAAAAVLAIARAVETATPRDQATALALVGACVLVRAQAVVLLAVFAFSVLADVASSRSARRLRTFGGLWAVLVVGGLAAAARPGIFGAYAGTLRGGYPLVDSLRYSYYHVALAVLGTAVVPGAATIALGYDALRGRADASIRALVWTTLATLLLVGFQVGFFAARFAPHLLGRDLAVVAVPLLVCFAVWCSRAPLRRRAPAGAVAVLVLAALVFAPWNALVDPHALPDSFEIAPLLRAGLGPAADVVALGAALLLLGYVFVPGRFVLALPLAVGGVLVWTSVTASDLVAARARADQAALVGAPANWVDRATREPVTYVYAGTSTWNLVWQQRFWNRRVAHVVSLAPSLVPGPMRQTQQRLDAIGLLHTSDRYVVASKRLSFVGVPIAQQTLSFDTDPLVLWRLDGMPRVSTVSRNVKPNGDMVAPGHVTAYDCGGGALEVTLLPKATDVVAISLDRKVVLRRRIAGLDSWHALVPVPPASRPRRCEFTIRGGPLLGSTVIAFRRAG